MWVVVGATLVALVATAVAVVALVLAGRRGETGRRAAADAAALRTVLDHALVGIAVLSVEDGGRWYVRDPNPALGHLLCRDVEGVPWPALLGPEEGREAIRTLDALASGRLSAWHGEHVVDVAGRCRSVHVSMAPLPVGGGGLRDVVVQAVDVTDRVSEQTRLRDLALHDALTGLPNRTLLADRLEVALAGTKRTGARVLVAFCDLDDFKSVNDTSGHAAGDHVLVTVAHRLREAVRPADTVARVGGDEFVLLCHGVAEQDAEALGRRVVDAVREPVDLGGALVSVGASVGVLPVRAHVADDGPDALRVRPRRSLDGPGAGGDRPDDALRVADDLLRRVDTAMYEAKRTGGGVRAAATSGAAGAPAPDAG